MDISNYENKITFVQNTILILKNEQIKTLKDWVKYFPELFVESIPLNAHALILNALLGQNIHPHLICPSQLLGSITEEDWVEIILFYKVKNYNDLFHRYKYLYNHLVRKGAKWKNIQKDILISIRGEYITMTDGELMENVDVKKVFKFSDIGDKSLLQEIKSRKELYLKLKETIYENGRRERLNKDKVEYFSTFINASPELISIYLKQNKINNVRECPNLYIRSRIRAQAGRFLEYFKKHNGWDDKSLQSSRPFKNKKSLKMIAMETYDQFIDSGDEVLSIGRLNANLQQHLTRQNKNWIIRFYVMIKSGTLSGKSARADKIYYWDNSKIIEFLSELELYSRENILDELPAIEPIVAKLKDSDWDILHAKMLEKRNGDIYP